MVVSSIKNLSQDFPTSQLVPLILRKKEIEDNILKNHYKKGFILREECIFSRYGIWNLEYFSKFGGSQFVLDVIDFVEKGRETVVLINSNFYKESIEMIFESNEDEESIKKFKTIINQLSLKFDQSDEKEDVFMFLLTK